MLEALSDIVSTSVAAVLMMLVLPNCGAAKTSERVIQLVVLSEILRLMIFPLIISIGAGGK